MNKFKISIKIQTIYVINKVISKIKSYKQKNFNKKKLKNITNINY